MYGTFNLTLTPSAAVQAEGDLADIPAVLHRLHATWQDHASFNSQTARSAVAAAASDNIFVTAQHAAVAAAANAHSIVIVNVPHAAAGVDAATAFITNERMLLLVVMLPLLLLLALSL